MARDWSARRVGTSLRATVRGAFVTGIAVVVPLLITVLVLAAAGQYVYTYLDIFSDGVLGVSQGTELTIPVGNLGFITVNREQVIELVTPVVLMSLLFLVGLFVNSTRLGGVAIDYFDAGIAAIPAVGSVYESFRQMSDVMLDDDTENFRDVKLVEFPHEGTYTLGFVTTETPDVLREPTGHSRMQTLFLPLAPNPVMGGHLVHVPEGKVFDVDMTVEEGIRAVVTSGVAVDGNAAGNEGLTPDDMRELASVEHAEQRLDPRSDSPDVRRRDAVDVDRDEEWDRRVDPERSGTPTDVARRTRAQRDGSAADDEADSERSDSLYADEEPTVTPAKRAGRYDAEANGADAPPAAAADRDDEHRRATRTQPAEVTDGSDLTEVGRAPDGEGAAEADVVDNGNDGRGGNGGGTDDDGTRPPKRSNGGPDDESEGGDE